MVIKAIKPIHFAQIEQRKNNTVLFAKRPSGVPKGATIKWVVPLNGLI